MFKPVDKIRSFYFETLEELRKCSWPTRQELRDSTVVVLISAAMLGVFVFGVDALVTWVIRLCT